MSKTKYIFILGSVLSGLGKGIVTVAIAKNFMSRGYKISIVKVDPYLNLDAGTINPLEHGECFVTNDGGELDVDFGHYERFLEITVSKKQNITTGQIYDNVIRKERKGNYLGKSVLVVPHITDEIIRRIKLIEEEQELDVLLIEVGGTIGDIESLPYLEAIRQFQNDHHVAIILLTYVPHPAHIGEHKTKPAQHSVKEFRSAGIFPDAIMCRSGINIPQKVLNKIAYYSGVSNKAVFNFPYLKNVFEAPQTLENLGLGTLLLDKFSLEHKKLDLSRINNLINNKIKKFERSNQNCYSWEIYRNK